MAVRDDGSETMISLDGIVVRVLESAMVSSETEKVIVDVSFPDVYNITASISLTVVEFGELSLSTSPYPRVSTYSGDITTLHVLSCSGVYQRLEASATGTLSDGTIKSTSVMQSYVSWESSRPDIATFAALCTGTYCRGLHPVSAGEIVIEADYQDHRRNRRSKARRGGCWGMIRSS